MGALFSKPHSPAVPPPPPPGAAPPTLADTAASRSPVDSGAALAAGAGYGGTVQNAGGAQGLGSGDTSRKSLLG